MLNFTEQLVNVRNSAEMESLASLKMCDEIDEKLIEMENVEKRKLDRLGHTMRQNQMLIEDLSKKSASLTNSLVPRNPIPPVKVFYPGHSQYSFRKANRKTFDEEYQLKLANRIQKITAAQVPEN